MAMKVGQFLDRYVFVTRFRYDAGQKVSADPETFPVKTLILVVNGSKDGCTDDPPDLT